MVVTNQSHHQGEREEVVILSTGTCSSSEKRFKNDQVHIKKKKAFESLSILGFVCLDAY